MPYFGIPSATQKSMGVVSASQKKMGVMPANAKMSAPVQLKKESKKYDEDIARVVAKFEKAI